MVGTPITLDLPTLSDPLAVAVAKIREALSQLGTVVSERVTQAGLQVTNSLDLAGNAAINVGQVKLAAGSTPTTAGSLYYDDDELWFVDADGAVKITNAGNVNIAGSNGFIGDYGGAGVTAGASYHNLTGQYRFYSNSGTLAFGDVSANATLLNSGNFRVKLGAPAGLAASYDVTFPGALPGANSVLKIDGAGFITADNTLPDSDLEHTTVFETAVPLNPAQRLIGTAGYAPENGGDNSDVIKATGGSTWTWVSQGLSGCGLRNGDRVKKISYILPATTSGVNNYTVTYFKQGGGIETTIQSWSFSGGTAINQDQTVTTPAAIASGENHYVRVSGPIPSGTDVLRYVSIGWDHP